MPQGELAPASVTTPRLAWVDVTRGLAVSAVVLFHVLLWSYQPIDGVHPVAAQLWSWVNQALGSLRMPVLLTVSGLVLSRQVRGGLHRATTLSRAASNYYLYVVWLVIYALVWWLSSWLVQGGLSHLLRPADVPFQLIVPGTTLWYVFALAVYIPLLSAAHRLSPPWVLGALVVLSTIAHLLREPGGVLAPQMWAKIPELFVFFAVGVHAAGPLRDLVQRRPRGLLLGSILLAGALTVVGLVVPGVWVDAVLFVPRGVVFVVMSVLIVSVAVRWSPFRRAGTALGRRTLTVYVAHAPLVATVVALVHGSAGERLSAALGSLWLALVYPVALTVGVTAVSLALQPGLERIGLRFLFQMPDSWRRAVAG